MYSLRADDLVSLVETLTSVSSLSLMQTCGTRCQETNANKYIAYYFL